MSNTNHCQQTQTFHPDVVSSGYLREHENELSITIPRDIQNEVSKFSQELNAYCIGTGLSDQENKAVQLALDGSIKYESLFIKLMSKGVANTKYVFVYTQNNKLYQIVNMNQVKEMDLAFMRNKNDEIIDIQSGTEHCLFLTKLGDVYSIGTNDAGYIFMYN